MPSTGSTSCCLGTGLPRWSGVKWRHDRPYHRSPQDHARPRKTRGSAPCRGAIRHLPRPAASTIQAAMGWTNSHLYEIRAGGVGWSTPLPGADWAGDFIDARKARLDNIIEDIGSKTLKYLYDFGDGWEHTISAWSIANRVSFIRV